MNYPPVERRIIIDTREQLPWEFEFVDKSTGELTEYATDRATIKEGDYELEGLHNICAIERKSLHDLVSSITHGRDRFMAELQRLQDNVEHPFVFVECSQQDVVAKAYPNNVVPRAVIGSRFSFEVDFPAVHWCWCGSRKLAEMNALVLFADIERGLKRKKKSA